MVSPQRGGAGLVADDESERSSFYQRGYLLLALDKIHSAVVLDSSIQYLAISSSCGQEVRQRANPHLEIFYFFTCCCAHNILLITISNRDFP
jgi:hypothetical protein